MASVPNEIDDIRRQMAQIRRELHEDVQGVVAGAEAVTDWRRYIRLYPWAAAGLALGVGFLIAPRRRRKSVAAQVAEAMPEHLKAAVQQVRQEVGAPARPVVITEAKAEKKEKRAGIIGSLLGMLAPIAWKYAQNYAMSYAEQWIAQQAAAGQNPLGFLQGIPGMPNIPGMPGAPAAGQAPPGYPPGPGQPGAPGARPGPPRR